MASTVGHGRPGLAMEICRKVGLPDVTEEYLGRKKIHEYIQYYDMKVTKENMKQDKYILIRNRDCRHVQPYMYEKNLLQSRMEFLWHTLMIDTRTTMKGKYQKDHNSCPHCMEGREKGVLETPLHLLSDCLACSDLREGANPELVLKDRAVIFLTRAIGRRK